MVESATGISGQVGWGEHRRTKPFPPRTAAGLQHNSLLSSRISRYVCPARFCILYIPGLSFPSANMDAASFVEGKIMVCEQEEGGGTHSSAVRPQHLQHWQDRRSRHVTSVTATILRRIPDVLKSFIGECEQISMSSTFKLRRALQTGYSTLELERRDAPANF